MTSARLRKGTDSMNDKEKRRQHRKSKKTQGRKAFTTASLPKMPSPLVMEQTMQSMFGGAKDQNLEAQDLAYAAMDAATPQEALKLARRALELNPRCVDALLLVVRATIRRPEDLIESVAAAVRAGEEDLGKDFFDENRGYFWGILETRPYMRARAFLAELLAKSGRIGEAIEHLEAMLELNPGDNQGLRYVLLGHYLMLDRLDGARQLLEQFEDDGSAMFAWGRVLERFLAGDHSAAQAALKEARVANRFAEDYLTGRKRLPRQLPGYYGIGDENEGVVCAVELGEAWAKHREAIEWLSARR
jgi:tetratricopeptide (TPR) repeat protein